MLHRERGRDLLVLTNTLKTRMQLQTANKKEQKN
jgi:hypothetical protein